MRMQQRKRRWEISPHFKRLLHLVMNSAIHDVGKAIEIIFVIVNNRLADFECLRGARPMGRKYKKVEPPQGGLSAVNAHLLG